MDLIIPGSTSEQALAAGTVAAIAYAHLREAFHHWWVALQPATVKPPIQSIRRAAAESSSAEPAPCWEGQNCSILMTDIVGFGAPYRTDQDRLALRRIMYQLLRDACENSGIPWLACHREDRGDGALIVIPPFILTRLAVHPLLPRLHAGLKRYNRGASKVLRIQLRLSLDVGPVTSDAEGVSGVAIIHTARMLEAPAFKRHLTSSKADLGFVTSYFVYDSVIEHDPDNIDPADYRCRTLHAKESNLTAWIRLL